MLVQQYLDGVQQTTTMQSEVLESLSPLERKLAEVMNRVEVRGKRGRRVAILIPQNLKKQMDFSLRIDQKVASYRTTCICLLDPMRQLLLFEHMMYSGTLLRHAEQNNRIPLRAQDFGST